MYRHDFKALWKKLIADKVLYKRVKSREIFTATSISVNSEKYKEKNETFSNNHLSLDQHNKNKEINSHKIYSSSTVPSGPGGGPANVFSREKLEQYMLNRSEFENISYFIFNGHMTKSAAEEKLKSDQTLLQCQIPINQLVSNNMLLSIIKSLCREHNINLISKSPKADWISACSNHYCNLCNNYITTFSVFTPVNSEAIRRSTSEFKTKKREINKKAYNKRNLFPPSPPSTKLQETIATEACESVSPKIFSEAGCTACCILTRNTTLTSLNEFTSHCKKKNVLDILIPMYSGTAVIERHSSSDPIIDIEGPLINKNLDKICNNCMKYLKKGVVPKNALANGIWLGEIPEELKDLKFAEKMLIARIQHNKCITIVRNGAYKMTSNAVTFHNPTPKIYNRLPPPREDLDQILACIFTGPAAPTEEDFERCPLLVRRKKVTTALEWLKLNHKDYYDLEISYDILKTYPENNIPVVVTFLRRTSNGHLSKSSSVGAAGPVNIHARI
jgi:hypothetical protein